MNPELRKLELLLRAMVENPHASLNWRIEMCRKFGYPMPKEAVEREYKLVTKIINGRRTIVEVDASDEEEETEEEF
jgi:hypothetical protein